MVTPEEQELIYERMAEAGIQNMGAYMRKMALNGYVLHVDLADVRELVSLQRRCANNLNQVAIHANTYGIYPSEIAALQKVGGGGALTVGEWPFGCSPAFSVWDILFQSGPAIDILVCIYGRSYNIGRRTTQ